MGVNLDEQRLVVRELLAMLDGERRIQVLSERAGADALEPFEGADEDDDEGA